MKNKKEESADFYKNIELKTKAREQLGVDIFDALSEEEQEIQCEIKYLAKILVNIYLHQQCEKTSHQAKRCEECREKRFNYSNF